MYRARFLFNKSEPSLPELFSSSPCRYNTGLLATDTSTASFVKPVTDRFTKQVAVRKKPVFFILEPKFQYDLTRRLKNIQVGVRVMKTVGSLRLGGLGLELYG